MSSWKDSSFSHSKQELFLAVTQRERERGERERERERGDCVLADVKIVLDGIEFSFHSSFVVFFTSFHLCLKEMKSNVILLFNIHNMYNNIHNISFHPSIQRVSVTILASAPLRSSNYSPSSSPLITFFPLFFPKLLHLSSNHWLKLTFISIFKYIHILLIYKQIPNFSSINKPIQIIIINPHSYFQTSKNK